MQASDIEVITEWPSHLHVNNSYRVKVPSRIHYGGQRSGNLWGYNIPPGSVAYSWTKLLLDQTVALDEFDDPSLRDFVGNGLLGLPAGKTPREVVTDYLSELYRHTMFVLERKITAEVLRVTPIEFWFTMPAIWSEEAQYATKNAAQRAGFQSRPKDKINMIREPAAAAIITLNELLSDDRSSLIEVSILCNGIK